MRHFYFNVRSDDVFEEDTEGASFSSPDIAFAEAVKSAREIVGETIKNGGVVEARVFEITDISGEVVFSIPFSSVIRYE